VLAANHSSLVISGVHLILTYFFFGFPFSWYLSVRVILCVNFCVRFSFCLLTSRASLYLCCSWWCSRNSLWQRLGIETMTSSFTTSSYSVSTKRKEGEEKMASQLCVAPCKFKVCKPVRYHTIQINQPTRCNNSSSLLLDVYVQLDMFRASSRPSSGAQQLQ